MYGYAVDAEDSRKRFQGHIGLAFLYSPILDFGQVVFFDKRLDGSVPFFDAKCREAIADLDEEVLEVFIRFHATQDNCTMALQKNVCLLMAGNVVAGMVFSLKHRWPRVIGSERRFKYGKAEVIRFHLN